jgi:indolepyruvate ferredoxin oxidoreductase alpha subunit
MHSGITGLIDVVYNRGFSTIIILDNRTTGMTGHQPNPSTGSTLLGEAGPGIDIEALCRAIGVKHVVRLNPHDHEGAVKLLREEIERPEPSVVISYAPCALLPEMKRRRDKKIHIVIEEKCTGCRSCLRIGCPAIEWVPMTPEEAKRLGYKETQKGHSRINTVMCDGCGQCAPLCKFGAIALKGEKNG